MQFKQGQACLHFFNHTIDICTHCKNRIPSMLSPIITRLRYGKKIKFKIEGEYESAQDCLIFCEQDITKNTPMSLSIMLDKMSTYLKGTLIRDNNRFTIFMCKLYKVEAYIVVDEKGYTILKPNNYRNSSSTKIEILMCVVYFDLNEF